MIGTDRQDDYYDVVVIGISLPVASAFFCDRLCGINPAAKNAACVRDSKKLRRGHGEGFGNLNDCHQGWLLADHIRPEKGTSAKAVAVKHA